MADTWNDRLAAQAERFLPEAARIEPETRRRAQLFIFFSVLGFIFGGLFAGFYFAIGHIWGGSIVLICTATMMAAPWIVRSGGLVVAGNIYAGVLVLGFTALTAIEGGLHGHAIAWLAVVPLCATILVDQRSGRWWCGICLVVVGAFCVIEFLHLTPPPFYAPKWETIITSAGYLSLTMFMAMVGLLFERGRRRSLAKLHTALDALSTANARLNELDRERAEFLGIAAHDLRSPLNSILGFAQILQLYGESDFDLLRDSLQRIINSGSHMRDMLDQLLSMRAIEEGLLELDLQPCDLNATAGHVVEGYGAKAQDKGIHLIYQPLPRPPQVEADPQALIQVLDNLISNAIKFSPINRPIVVRVRTLDVEGPTPGLAVVEVEDRGPGLSAQDQRKLYGKFAKLSARPTGGESSTGLGLSIVKRLVEGMNGQLECQSELGVGTTFSVTLRRVAAASLAYEGMPAPVGSGSVSSQLDAPVESNSQRV